MRQLDNDVEAIYGLLSTIEVTQERQLDRVGQIEDRLTDVVEVQHRHTAAQAAHTATLAEHTAALAEHGTRLDRIIALLEAR